MGPERRPVPEPGYRGDAGGHLLGESTGQPQSTPRVGRLPIMKPSRISCSPVAWWGLLLALCTGLGHAQTNTRWVEGLEAVGGIPLNLVQAMTPAGPKPLASIPSARQAGPPHARAYGGPDRDPAGAIQRNPHRLPGECSAGEPSFGRPPPPAGSRDPDGPRRTAPSRPARPLRSEERRVG